MSTEEIGPRQKAAATKRRRTNAWICDAARRLFDEHGYHGVTRDDISRESGMGSATVHVHFATKRALAIAAYAQPLLELRVSSEKDSTNEAGALAGFTDFICELTEHLVAHPALAYALLPLSRDPRSDGEDDEATHVVSFRDLVEHLAQLAGSTEDDADFALGGLLTWIVQHPGRPSEDAANVMLNLLL